MVALLLSNLDSMEPLPASAAPDALADSEASFWEAASHKLTA